MAIFFIILFCLLHAGNGQNHPPGIARAGQLQSVLNKAKCVWFNNDNKLVVRPCSGATNKIALIAAPVKYSGHDAYLIAAVGTGWCITVEDSSNKIRVKSCDNSDRQQVWWLLDEEFTGTYLLKNDLTGNCLDIPNWNTADDTELIQYQCNGRFNQQFIVTTMRGLKDPNLTNVDCGYPGISNSECRTATCWYNESNPGPWCYGQPQMQPPPNNKWPEWVPNNRGVFRVPKHIAAQGSVADGCSFGEVQYLDALNAACNAHDVCWWCGHRLGVSRQECNDIWYGLMLERCHQLYPEVGLFEKNDRLLCEMAAGTMKVGIDFLSLFKGALEDKDCSGEPTAWFKLPFELQRRAAENWAQA